MTQAKLPPAHVAGFETPAGEWTATAPSVPGWYWHRDHPGDEFPVPRQVWKNDYLTVLMCHLGTVNRVGGEWWSVPIQEPTTC